MHFAAVARTAEHGRVPWRIQGPPVAYIGPCLLQFSDSSAEFLSHLDNQRLHGPQMSNEAAVETYRQQQVANKVMSCLLHTVYAHVALHDITLQCHT